MIRIFLRAVQFLTIIPLRLAAPEPADESRSMVYFPLAGALLGLFAAAVVWCAYALGLRGFALGAVGTVALAGITGGLHLDGTGDTADAFLSRKDAAGMLEIMRDPRVGAMGVSAIVCALLLKSAFLSPMGMAAMCKALVVACCVSRWGMVFSACSFPYARKEGKAKAFIISADRRVLYAASAVCFCVVTAAGGLYGLLAWACVAWFAIRVNKGITRSLSGITGDTLGMVNEAGEIAALAVMALAMRMAGA